MSHKLPPIHRVVGAPSTTPRQHQAHPAMIIAFTGDLTQHITCFTMMLDMEKRNLRNQTFASAEDVEDQYALIAALKTAMHTAVTDAHVDFRGHDDDLYGSGLFLAVQTRRLPPVYLHRSPDYKYDKPIVEDDDDVDEDDNLLKAA